MKLEVFLPYQCYSVKWDSFEYCLLLICFDIMAYLGCLLRVFYHLLQIMMDHYCTVESIAFGAGSRASTIHRSHLAQREPVPYLGGQKAEQEEEEASGLGWGTSVCASKASQDSWCLPRLQDRDSQALWSCCNGPLAKGL